VNARLGRLRERMTELEVDAFLVSSPANRRYLSGFTGSNGVLAITADAALLLTDFRYIEQAQLESPDFDVRRMRGGQAWLPEVVAELSVSRLGVEADDLTVAQFSRLRRELDESDDCLDVEFKETSGVVERVRAVKDDDELRLLSRAVRIADEALAHVRAQIEPRMTERDIAWALHRRMRELGAEGPAFDTIIAAGPNGALPHHRADDTPVRHGDGVVIDMGANCDGYRSDLTRTFVVGAEPSEKFREIYAIVLKAQLAAIDAAKPGMTGEELDGVARQVIADAGYGEEFGHGLGHGVGLAIHERPMVVPTSEDVIEDGMIFTVEPGIYIPGWGGVRIEDIVVMQGGAAKVLTRSPK